MGAGGLDTRVEFWHRPDGLGDLEKRCAVWAGWIPAGASRKVEASALTDGVEGTLKVRNTPAARAITQADRARFRGQDMDVISASVPRRDGWLWIKVGRQLGSAGG